MDNQYYLDLQADGSCNFYCTAVHDKKIPETASPISTENYELLKKNGALNTSHKRVYVDNQIIPDDTGNQFKIRKVHTVFHEQSNTWIDDEVAIESHNYSILIAAAKDRYEQVLKMCNPALWDDYSNEYKASLKQYLKYLKNIIEGIDKSVITLVDIPSEVTR